MATSSSDESCSAPTDFDISSLDESNGKFSMTWERCPLCKKCKRTYYCKDCLKNGEFSHSTFVRFPERFIDKKERLCQISQERMQCLERVNKAIEPITRGAKLKSDIEACREKISMLKLVIKEVQDSSAKAKYEIQQNDEYIQKRKITSTLYAEKIRKMKRHKEAVLNDFNKRIGELNTCRKKIKEVAKENVNDLVHYIFPIKRVSVDERYEDSFTENTIVALAEATRTAYIKGRWIYTDNADDIQYKIVDSLLPGNGNYSVYNAWVAANRETAPTTSSELYQHRNSACAISSALTYLCQFVSMTAWFLDIHLPKRLYYREFCSHEMNKEDFANKVARLNANVLHICLSQNVRFDHLHPRHTAANLLLLFNPEMCDLGRCGPFEINNKILTSLEESLSQDLDSSSSSEDDELEEEMEISGDWEAIPEFHLRHTRGTASAMPNAQQRPVRHMLPSEAATSVAGGLVMSAAASVVSFWKAAIGHR